MKAIFQLTRIVNDVPVANDPTTSLQEQRNAARRVTAGSSARKSSLAIAATNFTVVLASHPAISSPQATRLANQ